MSVAYCRVKVSNSVEEITDYQILIELNETNCSNFFSNYSGDPTTIRVFDSSGASIDFWVEYQDLTNKIVKLWVKVPLLSVGDNYFTIGLDVADATLNDPAKVFLWYDDFVTDTSSNYSLVGTKQSGATPTLTIYTDDSMAVLGLTADGHGLVYTSNVSVSDKFIVEGKLADPDVADNSQVGIGITGSSEDIVFRLIDADSGGTHQRRLTQFVSGSINDVWYEDIVSDTEWHILSLKYYGGTFKLVMDNVEVASVDLALQDASYYPAMFVAWVSSAKVNFDWIRVRKYIDPEPIVAVFSIEKVGIITYTVTEEFLVEVNEIDNMGTITYTITETLDVSGPKDLQDNVGLITYTTTETLAQETTSSTGIITYTITETLTQTGGVEATDLVGEIVYSIVEKIEEEGAVDTQDGLGTITYTVSETLSIDGSVTTQDEVGSIFYSITETIIEEGAVSEQDSLGQITYTITETFLGSSTATDSVGKITYTITEELGGITTLPIIDVLSEPVRLEKLEFNGVDGYAILQAPKTLMEAKGIGFEKFFPVLVNGSLLGVFRVFKEERVPYGEGYRYYLKDPISFVYTINVSVKWSGSLLDNVVSLLSRYLKSISIVKDANATDVNLDVYVFKGKLGELLLDLKDKYGVIIYYNYDPTTTATSIVVSRKETYTLVGNYKSFVKTVVEETSNVCTKYVVVNQPDVVVEVFDVSLTYSGTSGDIVWTIYRKAICHDDNCNLREDIASTDFGYTVNILGSGSYTDSSGNTVYYIDVELLYYADSELSPSLIDKPTCPNFWIAYEDTIRDTSVWGDPVAMKKVRIETTNVDVSCPDTTNPEFYVRYHPNTSPVILENNVAVYGERYCNVDYETIQTLNDYNALEPSLLAKSSPDQILDVVVPLVLLAKIEGNISKVVGSKHVDVVIGSKLFTGLVVSDLKVKDNIVEMRLSTHDVPFPATVLRQNLSVGGLGRAKNIFPV